MAGPRHAFILKSKGQRSKSESYEMCCQRGWVCRSIRLLSFLVSRTLYAMFDAVSEMKKTGREQQRGRERERGNERQTEREVERQRETAREVLLGRDCLGLLLLLVLIGAVDVLSRRRHLNSTVMPRLRANVLPPPRPVDAPTLSRQTGCDKHNLKPRNLVVTRS